jgi:hypothetical protein
MKAIRGTKEMFERDVKLKAIQFVKHFALSVVEVFIFSVGHATRGSRTIIYRSLLIQSKASSSSL